MKSVINRLILLVLGWIALTVTGCATVDALFGEERYRSLKGNKLSDIKFASDLAFHEGQLIVANYGRNRGILFVDTATEIITEHLILDIEPSALTYDAGGHLYVLQELYKRGRSAGTLDLQSNHFHTAKFQTDWFGSQFVLSGGHLFLLTPPQTIYRVQTTGGGGRMSLQEGADLDALPRSVAIADGKVFISLEDTPYLLSRDAAALLRPDSFSVAFDDEFSARGITHPELIASGNRMYALVNRMDTSFVMVLDPQTMSVSDSVPLNSHMSRFSGVRDGVLYVVSRGEHADNRSMPVLDGLVEGINLGTGLGTDLITTESDLGGTLLDFVPTGPLAGYAMYYRGDKPGYVGIRKVGGTE